MHPFKDLIFTKDVMEDQQLPVQPPDYQYKGKVWCLLMIDSVWIFKYCLATVMCGSVYTWLLVVQCLYWFSL